MHDLRISRNTDLLTEMDTVIGSSIFFITSFENKYTSCHWSNLSRSGGHTVSLITAGNFITEIANQGAIHLETLKHNMVTKFYASIFSVSMRSLNTKDVIKTKEKGYLPSEQP